MITINDNWSVREKLALATAVSKFSGGACQWASVSQLIRQLVDEHRPSDWNSPENCALQYNILVDSVSNSKKKRGLSSVECNQAILKKLRDERVEELRSTAERAKNAYQKLKEQIESLQEGSQNHRLQEIWKEIQREQQLKQEKENARTKVLEERERRAQEANQATLLKEKNIPDEELTTIVEEVLPLQPDLRDEDLVDLITEEIIDIQPSEYEISVDGSEYQVPFELAPGEFEIPEEIQSHPEKLDEKHLSLEDTTEENQVANEVLPMKEEEMDLPDLPVEEVALDQISVALDLLEDLNQEPAFKTPPTSPQKEAVVSPQRDLPGDTSVPEPEETQALNTTQEPLEFASPTKKVTPDLAVVQAPLELGSPEKSSVEAPLSPKRAAVVSPRPERSPEKRIKETEEADKTSVDKEPSQEKEQMEGIPEGQPEMVMETKDIETEEIQEANAPDHPEPESEQGKVSVSEVPHSDSVLLGEEETKKEAPEPRVELDSREDADLKTWRKSITLVWKELSQHKNSSIFTRPISDEKVKGYSAAVKRPMDLSTVKKNIDSGVITTTTEFYRDVMLMFTNAMMFNSSQSNVYAMALDMQRDAMEIIQNYINTQLIVQADKAKSPSPDKEAATAPSQPPSSKKVKKPQVITPQSTPEPKRRRTTRNSENL